MNKKQKRFADEYLIDLNATRAYKEAYKDVTDETAAANGSKLLRHAKVKPYIQKCMKDREKRTKITQDNVIQELAEIALSDVTNIVNVQGHRIVIKDTEELPPQVRKTIKAIKPHRDGIELEFHDKTKALELLGRHMGLFDDRISVETTQEERVADVLEGLVNAVHGETD